MSGRAPKGKESAEGVRREVAMVGLRNLCGARAAMFPNREAEIRPSALVILWAGFSNNVSRDWLRRSLTFLVGCGVGVLIMGARERAIDTGLDSDAIVRIVPAKVDSPHKGAAWRASASHRILEYSLEISNTQPKVGRGVRITLNCKEAARAGDSKPFLRLMDPHRGEYRTALQPGVNPGEWFWHSGLEVVGRWTGIAYIPTRGGLKTARLPAIEVQP